MPAGDVFCKYPGCGKAVGRKNLTGLCQAHTHAPGMCTCVRCLAGEIGPKPSRALPKHLRSVTKHRSISNAPEPDVMQITMPVAPWEMSA